MNNCIINTEDREITDVLTGLGYNCIPVIESDLVSRPICAHSDVLYRKLESKTILISSCQMENKPYLERLGYTVLVCKELAPGYKTESLLNFIINDKYIIKNEKTAINLSSEYCTDKIILNVKQGYTCCSTLMIKEDVYITDDENIFNVITSAGLDCLKKEKGDIELTGYDYGFIGGASVKLKDNRILFFGDIENKIEKDKIIRYLKKNDMEPIFISGKKLKDIGSALIL